MQDQKDNLIKDKNIAQSTNALMSLNYDKSFQKLFKKSEKLNAAIYMVSNFFSESDPMKWKLRAEAISLLENVFYIKNRAGQERENAILAIKDSILKIVSFLNSCFVSGMISEMNFKVFERELNLMFESLLEQKKISQTEIGESVLPRDFFLDNSGNVEQNNDGFNSSRSEYNINNESVSKLNSVNANVEMAPVSKVVKIPSVKDLNKVATSIDINKGQKLNDDNVLYEKDNLLSSPYKTVEIKKSKRQEAIYNLLQKKGELTIRDVSVIVGDCSEKTVQRELSSMVKSGILKKVGERRWSKYSIV